MASRRLAAGLLKLTDLVLLSVLQDSFEGETQVRMPRIKLHGYH